jgi:tetratricopeptide (TPR) repeat protein
MINNVAFCIIGQSRSEGIIRRAIASILRQRIPRYEIIVYGELPETHNIRVLPSNSLREIGALNRIRNLLCTNATEDFVVLMTDNIEFRDGWYEAIKEADYLDIIGSRLVTDKGIRAVDWAYEVQLGSMRLPNPLDYDEWTTKAYVSGNLILLRKRAWERIKFNERLSNGDRDDVDFCLRATRAGFRVGVIPQAEAKCNLGNSEITSDITFEPSRTRVVEFKTALMAGKDTFKAGEYRLALTHLRKAAELVPDDAGVLALMGWTYYFTGQYENALEALGKAVAADSTNHYALRGRGWTFLQSGAPRKAVNDLRKALDLTNSYHRDDWVETMRGLSWACYHLGDFDEAIKYFKVLLENCQSGDADLLQDVYRGLGWCFCRKGMWNEAAVHFRNALPNIDPRRHEVLQDAEHGIELSTVGQAGTVQSQGCDRHLFFELTSTRQPVPTPVTRGWRRSLVSGLKATLKKILKR